MKKYILKNTGLESETGFKPDGFVEFVNISSKTIYKRISETEIEKIEVDNAVDLFSFSNHNVSIEMLEHCIYRKQLSEEDVKQITANVTKRRNIEL